MAVRGVFAVALLLVVLPWLGLRVGRPERFTWLRAAGEVAVTFAFLAALARLPIGDTYTLYFAGPLLLTAGAALFLRRARRPAPLGRRDRRFPGRARGPGAAVELAGCLAAGIGRGAPQRRARSHHSLDPALGRLGHGGAADRHLCHAVGLGHGPRRRVGALGWRDVGLCALAAFGVAAGYTAFVVALRTGELSFVATFRYSGIPMAMLLGLAVWGDVPSAQMLAGAALIMGSGLYMISRPH